MIYMFHHFRQLTQRSKSALSRFLMLCLFVQSLFPVGFMAGDLAAGESYVIPCHQYFDGVFDSASEHSHYHHHESQDGDGEYASSASYCVFAASIIPVVASSAELLPASRSFKDQPQSIPNFTPIKYLRWRQPSSRAPPHQA